ncbi:ABC-2 family transporter protein [Streptomyces sp. WMMB 714]|uniref:ABC transporter permease n=1 Tax=Streptomyces sp. WMMB 714 TaxID=1286822 RepID=UPI0005F7E06D|nr:ABC transporter permease [Streptomyces sp. WMMB 714]SCK51816.1 ABC-2 family transporter protein [Streptomyces sp. WMMB 714]
MSAASTATAVPPASTGPVASFTAAARSEWVKVRSLRSSMFSLLAVVVATVGISALVCAVDDGGGDSEQGFDALFASFYGLNFGQIAAIAFAVTAFSSEFHNGALRVSLSAVPRRGVFYVAKTAVVGGLVLAAGLVAGFSAFLAGQHLLGAKGLGLADPGALRACFGSAVYLTLMALFACGLTALLRSGVAVLSTLIPFLLIVPFVLGDLAAGAAEYLPDRAGQLVLQQNPGSSLGPWTGLAVTAVWALAAVVAGWVAVRRRDA